MGSIILDVVMNDPSVGMVILAGANIDEVAIHHRIGCGLSAKKDWLNIFLVLDFEDLFYHSTQPAKPSSWMH